MPFVTKKEKDALVKAAKDKALLTGDEFRADDECLTIKVPPERPNCFELKE